MTRHGKFRDIRDDELMSASQLVEQLQFTDTLNVELLTASQEYNVQNDKGITCSSNNRFRAPVTSDK